MVTPLTISVVIPTYRRPASLAACLAGLARQQRLPDEVLIACRSDDHETAAMLTAEAPDTLNWCLIPVGVADASTARNRCLELAIGEIVAMIDDDAVPRSAWLAAIEAAFRTDPHLGGLGGPDWPRGRETPEPERPEVVGKVQWWGRRIGNHHRGSRRPLAVEWLKGANMSFRRTALAGLRFGEGLRGDGAQFAEDVALSLRVRRAGWRLRYDPAVGVDHYPAVLRAEGDHRALADEQSLADAARNETVALLDYLPPLRRAVFLAWAMLIGTRLLPGMAIALMLFLQQRYDALTRGWIVLRARRDGWRTWRAMQGGRRASIVPDRAQQEVAGAQARKRICLVTHVVTPGDGQGMVNYELARHLLRQGHEVTLVASQVALDLRRESGLTWIHVPVPARAPEPLKWMLFALGAWWRLGWTARQFDVVHLNGAIAPLPAHVNTSHFVHAAVQRLGSTRQRWTPTALYQRAVTAISSYCERRAYPAAGRVVAVSEVVRRSLTGDVGLTPRQVEVIPLGVDAERFRPRAPGDAGGLRQELGLGRDTFLMLFVGDAKSPRKNLDLALRVLARLEGAGRLAVIGRTDGGPYPALADRLGVRESVHFLGARDDVAACYRDADLVWCASHYEPASLVLLEAMASGVPVITTAVVGNAVFVVDHDNGFVLPSSTDVEGATAVARSLAGDVALRRRIGAAARATVEPLTWDRMGRRYERLYQRLGHEPRSAGATP